VPVVVTDATNPVGEAAVRLLAGRAEVRAFARGGALPDALRAAGAKITERTLDDPDAIRSALNDAHTVLHTSDAMFFPEDEIEAAIVSSTERLLAASTAAGIRRFLLLSSVGADAHSPNVFLRSSGRAEELVAGTAIEHAVVRVTLVRERLAQVFPRWFWWAVVPGHGRQRFAPVPAALVARALVAADDRAGSVAGTYALGGDDVRPARSLAAVVHPHRPRLSARQRSWLARRIPLTPTALQMLSVDRVPDAQDAGIAFGLRTRGSTTG
jgi:uncharacterized protein YbjT (DUF2867 family)